jgi:hypothetical protein
MYRPIAIQTMNRTKKLLLAALICLFAGNAAGQQIPAYEESQARLIEPKQDVFVVPLVADIEVLDNQTRQDYGPYRLDPKPLLSTMTFEEIIDNLKARALYMAAREADADLIVAATFNVKPDQKEKVMIINVSGYPSKYINFRPLKLEKAEDYEWIQVVYPATYRTQAEKQVNEAEKEKAARK